MAVPTNSSQIDLPSSSHRLPTLSASQALKDLEVKQALRTNIASFDQALSGRGKTSSGGFERGKVSEVWGPSGAGKTGLICQTAREALQNGAGVVWVDGSTPLNTARLKPIREKNSVDSSSGAFHYISLSALSRLLALVLHPPEWFPQDASLLVVDGLEVILDNDFPRLPWVAGNKTETQKWQAGRRYAVLGTLVSGLNRLAAVYDMAVIVTTGCGTRVRSDYGLNVAIAPGLGGSEWEAGVWNRVLMFRDTNGRFIGVQKCRGRNLTPLDPVGEIGTAIRFDVSATGVIRQAQVNTPPATQKEEPSAGAGIMSSPTIAARKRHYEEIADSDDEAADEYGWIDLDEDPAPAEGLVNDHEQEQS